MFDSVSALIEEGESFAQDITASTLTYARGTFPCKIGGLRFHEMLRADGGGLSAVRSMVVTVRRADIPSGVEFTVGQKATVKRKLRGERREESVELEVGQVNSSDGACVYLTLERPAV